MLQAIWKGLLGLVAGPVLEGYRAKLASENDAQRLSADIALKQIDAEIEARGNARTIRLATAGHLEQRALTFIIAAPFALHAGAVGLDTTFGFGWAIAKYPPPFDEWEQIILLSFFGIQAVSKVANTVALGILGRRG